jgi:hypothetical protein
MQIGLISIDNFYDDPDNVRDIALSSEYDSEGVSLGYRFGRAPWPGKMSKESHAINWVDAKVSKLLNKHLRQMPMWDSGKFRMSPKGTKSLNVCHVDTVSKKHYAGVLYLNKNKSHVPGTIFYTHKNTGYDSAINNQQIMNLLKDGHDKDETQWEVNMTSNVVYNRLIIYPANKFHSPGDSFGTGKNARLVQVFAWEILT